MAASFKGKLLVASPQLLDPNFYRTVLLVFEHDENGALGVILNRPTEESVHDHLPAWDGLVADPAVIFIGGPVSNEIAIGVTRRTDIDDEWSRAFDDVAFVDLDLPPEESSDPVRVYSGYAGWEADQLEVELALDSWFVVDAEPEDVFGDPRGLWSRVLRRQPGRLRLFADFPHDLTSN